jgi:hypothetical protein
MFPRDNHLSIPAVVIEHRDREKYPPFDLDEAPDIASRVEFVGEGFSDDTSSSKVRLNIRNNRSLDAVDESITMHPIVLRAFLDLSNHVGIWGSSFNDGTTQTALDPPGRGGAVRTSPRNPRFPIVHFDIQTSSRARVSIFKSGISGSGSHP